MQQLDVASTLGRCAALSNWVNPFRYNTSGDGSGGRGSLCNANVFGMFLAALFAQISRFHENDRNSSSVNTWYNGGGMEWGVAVLFCTRSNYRVLHNHLGPLTPITKTYVFYHTKHTNLTGHYCSLYDISLPSLALWIRIRGCVHMICEGC